MKRSPISRRTGLVRRTPLRRTAIRRSAPRPTVPVDVRAALGERSGGVCEIAVRYRHQCAGAATQVHHRALKGVGGVHGDAVAVSDRLSSLLHGCGPCHGWVHANPEKAAVNGWIVPRGSDSSSEPVWRRGVLVYLTDGGEVVDFERAAA